MTKLVARAVVLLAVLTAAGCGEPVSRTETEGSLAFSILAAGATPVATIAIRDVLDPEHTYFVECHESTGTVPTGGVSCDALVLLPSSLYEVVVQPADSTCHLEQDRFTAIVEPGATTEIAMTLVCATDTGPIVTDYAPAVEDVEFTFPDGMAASKYVCSGGDEVTVTITVADPDAGDCSLLSHGWYAGDASGSDWTEALLGATSETPCRYSATIVADSLAIPLGQYLITFWVSDPEGNFTSITVAVIVIDCTPPP